MIHDSYKNFFQIHVSQTFDDLFIKWISQRLLCLVLRSFFGVQTFVFIQNYIDSLTTVSLYHHSFCPDIESLEKQADYQPRMHELYGGVQGHAPPEKKKQFKFWLAETPYPAIPGSNAINSYLFCCASLSSRFSSFVLPEPKYKDSWLPSFKIKDSWFLQVL